ncbi:hypothetical protein [Spiroplasma endosymbiont of Othius punctulatus]|uniref:hypothetical protein n=1 Tax=Spiroplasma endosymbiont of Othius punctulatus TaxID=3066289 RepID=UPI0030CEBC6C
MAKKYRMRTVPESQEEVIDYVDPRSSSFQALDADPEQKIISSLVTDDLNKVKDRTKRALKKKQISEKDRIYFSTGKEGFARTVIVISQIVIFAAFMSLMATMANTFFGLTNNLITGIPGFTNKLLFLFSPLIIIAAFILITGFIGQLLFIVIPILSAQKIETVSFWTKTLFFISISNGIVMLLITIVITVLFNLNNWEVYNSLQLISFTPFITSISIAIVTTFFGFVLLFSSVRGVRATNKRIVEANIRNYNSQ